MNSKKNVKLIIGILVGLICIALVVTTVIYYIVMNESYDDDLTTAERDLKIVTETYPTEFVVYGDEIDFDKAINVKYINEISEEVFDISDNYKYQLIIINDLSGECHISSDEWKMLNDLVSTEKRRNLFYLGDKEVDNIKQLDMADEMLSYEEDDLSVGFVHEKGLLVTVGGTYVKGAKYSLTEVLLHEQANSIKVSNE